LRVVAARAVKAVRVTRGLASGARARGSSVIAKDFDFHGILTR
jgi:hypothetical protein